MKPERIPGNSSFKNVDHLSGNEIILWTKWNIFNGISFKIVKWKSNEIVKKKNSCGRGFKIFGCILEMSVN